MVNHRAVRSLDLVPPPPQHTELQLTLAQAEIRCGDTKAALERTSSQKNALELDNRSLETERDDLRQRVRRLAEENGRLKDKLGAGWCF